MPKAPDLSKNFLQNSELDAQVNSGKKVCADALKQVEDYAAKALACSSEVAMDSRLPSSIEIAYRQHWNDSEIHATSAKRWEEAIQTRFQASRHLRTLNGKVQEAKQLLDHELSEKTMAEGQVNAAIERRHSSYESHRHELDLFVEACRSWALSLVELQPPASDDLFDNVADWCERTEGPNPVRLAAEAAFAQATMRLSERIAALESELSNELRKIAELEIEQRFLRDGIHIPPPTPHTRTPGPPASVTRSARSRRGWATAGGPAWPRTR